AQQPAPDAPAEATATAEPTATPAEAPPVDPSPMEAPGPDDGTSPITLPPLPADSAGASADWPTAALGAMATDHPRGDDPAPSPPAELPALPPPAEELMELGRLGDQPAATAGVPPATGPAAGTTMVADDPEQPRRVNEYRD